VTVPDESPRGIVVSLAGTGRHNVIGSTFCSRLSLRLAAVGLATVRLDYAGVGDSPGLVYEWTLADVTEAVEQTRAALAVAMDVLALETFTAVGTCYGTRVALSLVPDPRCRGAVCLGSPVLEHAGLVRAGGRVVSGKLLSLVRSQPALRRFAGLLVRAGGPQKPAARVVAAFEQLDRKPIAFLYGDPPTEDHYSARSREVLDQAIGALPAAARANFDLRLLPWGPLTTFNILAPADQDAVLDAVVPLVLRSLDPREATAVGA
jgi:hypothetical protein